MDYTTAARYAHEAEVVNRTGLGDVLAQTKGGLEIRVYPGGPGIGEIKHINHRESQRVILAGAPGLKTHDVLTDPESRQKINNVGDQLIERMISNPSLDTFITCSRIFTESVGLATKRVLQAIHDLDSSGFRHSSMVMLGDSVFCFCDDNETDSVIDILTSYWERTQVTVTSISDMGGRLISW